MVVYAVDPGDVRSGLVAMQGEKILQATIFENSVLKRWLRDARLLETINGEVPMLVLEQVASMGMSVGATVFETCFWSGRFAEAWERPFIRIPRRDVKLTICGQANAKDTNIRTALLDHYGPGKDKAVGTKKAPGPLFGFKADLWAALALGLTHQIREGHVTLGRTQVPEN